MSAARQKLSWLLWGRYFHHPDRDARTVRASQLFDPDWYLQQNPDVRAAEFDPLEHYLKLGAAEGRDPHPSFDSDWYLAENPDVRAAGLNPLIHYLRWGVAEGRKPSASARVEPSQAHSSNPKMGGPALTVDGAGAQEELELQLYLLRSDHQRTVNLAERLRGELEAQRQEKETLLADMFKLERRLTDSERTSHSALTALKHEKEAILATTANIERQLAENERVRATGTDLELYHARVLSRLSVVTAEVVGLRRTLQPSGGSGSAAPAKMRTRYLDLLENMLTGRLYEDSAISPWSREYNADVRLMGRDWPEHAETMIGVARMRNIRLLAENVIEDQIPGDFLEAGVWRGGACIYMRGILAAYDVGDRNVWVADSFAGLPPPNPELSPADEGDPHHTFKELIVPLENVKANFAKYDLLDEQVRFLPGWFQDTLPAAPIQKLAILRLDGDMYKSTLDTLEPLYAKVEPGGYVIIDDYILAPCKKAVDDFREKNNIVEPLQDVDGAAVYWRKESPHKSGA